MAIMFIGRDNELEIEAAKMGNVGLVDLNKLFALS